MNLGSFSFALAVLVARQPCALPFTHNHYLVSRISFTPKFPSLFGIMDEVQGDNYLLGQNDNSETTSDDLAKAYEVFLAELVFSTNDPRLDIVDKAELAFDPSFVSWLDNKIKGSTDPEEKLALRDLYEMILNIKEQIELSKQIDEREQEEEAERERIRMEARQREIEEGSALSDAEVIRRAAKVDSAAIDSEVEGTKEAEEKRTFYNTELTPEIRMSYDKLLKEILPPYTGKNTVETVVYKNYDKFDAQFVKVLNERRDSGEEDANLVLEALAAEQQKRVGVATENLKFVLSMGDPNRMMGGIVKLAKEGKIDEAFLLLLEANADQAERSGASGPAQLMRNLKTRAIEEKDKKAQTKEIKLLRKLLRAADSAERAVLLEDAFTPKDSLIVPGTTANAEKALDGEAPEEEKPQPEVAPPDFINSCKAFLINFGNLEDTEGDMTSKIKQIAAEAEVIATQIYGVGMETKEQQDRMYKEQTTSIFDLETMEINADQMGEKAPWATKDIDDEILPGFDKDGKMRIGGL